MACTLRRLMLRPTITIKQGLDHFKINDIKVHSRYFKTSAQKQKKGGSKLKLAFLVTAAGVGAGTAYSMTLPKENPIALLNPVDKNSTILLDNFPDVKISRTVKYATDSSGLKLTLFQYTTCPFCCKVRAFLDYYGISYDVVEVNPVFRQQVKWTDYRKVPILLVNIGDKYLQLNDSTMIISVLTSHLLDTNIALEELANNYPIISYKDDDGAVKKEILNRYFLMYHRNIPTGSTKETIITEERKWRKWADDVLVHMLSPNVYRNAEEALQAFNWFSEVGDWKSNFSAVEIQLVVYTGAFAMWLIGKRLKQRHHLKDDVRFSLYDETHVWLREVKKQGTFHGGDSPDLADLAVYGVLNSIEGCDAFKDLLKNTNIKKWYFPMKDKIQSQSGTPLLLHSS